MHGISSVYDFSHIILERMEEKKHLDYGSAVSGNALENYG